jgi:hypothetical protein
VIHSFYPDEDNCAECDEVLAGLEKIDDETDALDITFVKVTLEDISFVRVTSGDIKIVKIKSENITVAKTSKDITILMF